MELQGEGDRADRIDRVMDWVYPLAYIVLFAIVVWRYPVNPPQTANSRRLARAFGPCGATFTSRKMTFEPTDVNQRPINGQAKPCAHGVLFLSWRRRQASTSTRIVGARQLGDGYDLGHRGKWNGIQLDHRRGKLDSARFRF
jgi:hypothetical protein